MTSDLTHFNEQGRGKMVDVTSKDDSVRVARAYGKISMGSSTLALIQEGRIKKGDVLGVAQTAAVMGSKQTWQLVPMCHPLLLTGVDISFTIDEESSFVAVESKVTTTGKTGVEMEALTAVTVACLTIYDMCKAVDKDMVIEEVYLLEKSGGKSGHYKRKNND